MKHHCDHHETIHMFASRAFFASAWADQQEENGVSLRGEIMDMIPDKYDPAALHAADTLCMDWERKHGEPICESWKVYRDRISPEDFGHYAAMQAMGHGVGLFDYDIGLDVPHVEFGAYSLERDYPAP